MAGKTVTRAQLTEAVYQEVGLSRNESADLIESVLAEISGALSGGEMVKTYEKYLSHIDYEHFEGLSVHKIVNWDFDDIHKFESNRLHCSSGYELFNIQCKRHLLYKTVL